jgi:hypothetical protein
MNICATMREELLEAAPDELAGVAQTPIAEHVRECRRCGPIARVLVEEHARLGTALTLVQPRLSADAAADDILATPDPVPESRWRTRAEGARRFLAAAFPMAAAAAIAAYFVYGVLPAEDPIVVVTAMDQERPARVVRATVPEGGSAVVLRTANENITLVWITPREIAP